MSRAHISDMVDLLIPLQVSPAKRQEAIDRLSEYWKDKIALVWRVEDIQDHIWDQFQVELTEEDARDFLQRLLHKHDADVGLCWSVIDANFEYEQDAKKEQQRRDEKHGLYGGREDVAN